MLTTLAHFERILYKIHDIKCVVKRTQYFGRQHFCKWFCKSSNTRLRIKTYNTNYNEFEFNRFKKVLGSVGQSEYHNMTRYTSKLTSRAVLCYAAIQTIKINDLTISQNFQYRIIKFFSKINQHNYGCILLLLNRFGVKLAMS